MSPLPALVKFRTLHRVVAFQSQAQKTLKRNYADTRLVISPSVPTCVDEVLYIHASGLPPTSPVTMTVTCKSEVDQFHFMSRNLYLTSLDGNLSIEHTEALPGSDYEGIDPMGPFWSMVAQEDSKSLSLLTTDVTKYLSYHIQVWLGHKSEGRKRKPSLLTERVASRYFTAPNVVRLPIKEGRVRGALFLPTDGLQKKKFPLVMTILGGVYRGAIVEEKAAVLASKGFATLAVAFFGVDDLPQNYAQMEKIEIEYFEEALDLVTQKYQDKIDPKKIGIFGFSKGGDIALSCAAFLKGKIRSCVVINSCIASVQTPTTYKGQRVEGFQIADDLSRIKMAGENLLDISDLAPDLEENSNLIIPFAECPADLLFIAGEDDKNYKSRVYADHARRLMETSGKMNFDIQTYPGLGHMCALPNAPNVYKSNHPLVPAGVEILMGGDKDKYKHKEGINKAWKKTVQFFGETLKN